MRSESSAGCQTPPNLLWHLCHEPLMFLQFSYALTLFCARDVIQVAGTPVPALQNVPASPGFLLNIHFIAMLFYKCNSHLWGTEELTLQGWYSAALIETLPMKTMAWWNQILLSTDLIFIIFQTKVVSDGIQQVSVTQQRLRKPLLFWAAKQVSARAERSQPSFSFKLY